MQLEEKLVIGQPMLPSSISPILSYDSCPLIGTFQQDGTTILFWAADGPDDPVIRYVYVELSPEEAAGLAAYFRDKPNGRPAYEHHPLLMNRRVVVGLSDEDWLLSRTAVIEHPTPHVFDEVDQLFPVE